MASRVVGTCHLCLRLELELRNSHIVPAAAYKKIRGTGTNPNPVRVTTGRALQTSAQVTEHLLCGDCEQHLGIDDNYAVSVAYQPDGSAPLLDKVLRMGEVSPDSYTTLVPVGLNTDALLRFGASVVWRAHVCSHIPGCRLGPYGGEFRRYLLGEAPFPARAACVLFFLEDAVAQGSPIDRLITMPVSVHADGFYSHRTIICGLHFELIVGRRFPSSFSEFCLARGNPKQLLLASSHQAVEWIWRLFREAKPAGSFARMRR